MNGKDALRYINEPVEPVDERRKSCLETLPNEKVA